MFFIVCFSCSPEAKMMFSWMHVGTSKVLRKSASQKLIRYSKVEHRIHIDDICHVVCPHDYSCSTHMACRGFTECCLILLEHAGRPQSERGCLYFHYDPAWSKQRPLIYTEDRTLSISHRFTASSFSERKEKKPEEGWVPASIIWQRGVVVLVGR